MQVNFERNECWGFAWLGNLLETRQQVLSYFMRIGNQKFKLGYDYHLIKKTKKYLLSITGTATTKAHWPWNEYLKSIQKSTRMTIPKHTNWTPDVRKNIFQGDEKTVLLYEQHYILRLAAQVCLFIPLSHLLLSQLTHVRFRGRRELLELGTTE
jgi:hypothetical protein